MRFLQFLFFLTLLVALSMATMIYLDGQHSGIHNLVYKPDGLLGTYPAQIVDYYHTWAIPSWVGLSIVLGIVVVYSLGCNMFEDRRREVHKASFLSYFVCILLTVGFCFLVAIYLWPQNTIHFGNLWTFERGSRDEFLKTAIHIAIMVGDFLLFVFLLMGLQHSIFHRNKVWHIPQKDEE